MKVILKKDHSELGKKGEVVSVKDGYAMNFLIPNHIAMKANEGNMRVYDELKRQQAKKIAKEIADTEQLGSELAKLTLEIKMKAGEDAHTYGSVNSQILSEALGEKGFKVDKKQIELEEPIKELGIFTIQVKLNNNVKTSFNVSVIQE
jgi:large subunit ribosomal protein L9